MLSAPGSDVSPGARAHVSGISGLGWATRPPSPRNTGRRGSGLAFHEGRLQNCLCRSRHICQKSLQLSPLHPSPDSSQQSAFVGLPTEHARRWTEEAEGSCPNPRHARPLGMTPVPCIPSPQGRHPCPGGGGGRSGSVAVPGKASLTRTPEPCRSHQPARESPALPLKSRTGTPGSAELCSLG